MKASRNILLIFLSMLGISALGGGTYLIVSPSGKMIGMSLKMLENSPFPDFLIPGIVLFIILGICPLLLVYALIKRPESKLAESFNLFGYMHWTWGFTVYISFALIIWIETQILMTRTFDTLQNICVFLSLAILFTALLPGVRDLYKR
jgi:uncharacterized membrane protein SpoIIM required for sporulation